MNTIYVRANQNHAPMPTTRVVYWSERVGGWWYGLSRICAEPNCCGYMDATPQDIVGPGAVSCLSCGRETADVMDKRPRPHAANRCPCGANAIYERMCMGCRERGRKREVTRSYRERQRQGVQA